MPVKFYPALQIPGGFSGLTTLVPTAAMAKFVRFMPRRKITLRGVSIIVANAATNNDETAVSVYAADRETRLATSGGVLGKANQIGRIDYDFLEDVVLDPANGPFYIGHQYGAVGGTAATYEATNMVTNRLTEIGGNGVAAAYLILIATPTFPFATKPVMAIANQVPIMLARER